MKVSMNISKGIHTSNVFVIVAKSIRFLHALKKYGIAFLKKSKAGGDVFTVCNILPFAFTLISVGLYKKTSLIFEAATEIL